MESLETGPLEMNLGAHEPILEQPQVSTEAFRDKVREIFGEGTYAKTLFEQSKTADQNGALNPVWLENVAGVLKSQMRVSPEKAGKYNALLDFIEGR